MNKRGQGMSINTIILIVLGVLVLVMVIAGFMMGWSRILPWIKPSNNVDSINDQCNLACNLDQQYNYCSKPVTLFAEDGIEIKDTTCFVLANETAYDVYGISDCPTLICPVAEEESVAE